MARATSGKTTARRFPKPSAPPPAADPPFKIHPQNNKLMKNILLPIVLPVVCLLVVATAGAALMPVDLRCDYAANPAGVDSQNPRLFWSFETTGHDQKQSAFQVLVASSAKLLAQDHGDLWDSGKVTSDETIQIPCPGDGLKSSEQVFW